VAGPTDSPNVFWVSLRRFDVKPGGRTREVTLRRTFG
jgi:hypothetical protein